jgi:hypothetical protein
MGMLLQSISYAVGKWVGALILGAVVLWQVVEHAGTTNGGAIVHVSTTPADVTIDDAAYHVDSLEQTPIVCELRAGRHKVRMLREGRVVYEEEFTIVAGQELVLAAWDQYVDGRSPARAGEIPPGQRRPLDRRRNNQILTSSRR